MPGTVTVPSTLSGHAAEIWRAAFLGSYEGTCAQRSDKDACAASIAWAAVKQKYKKGEDGAWVAKDAQEVPMSQAPEQAAQAAESEIERRDFSTEERDRLGKSGAALPDGSFPIQNEQDLRNAIHAIGRASDRGRAMAHIKKRAKALGLTELLPDEWREKSTVCDCDEIAVRRMTREADAAKDALIARADYNVVAPRPDYVPADIWRELPGVKRTYGSLVGQRSDQRAYEEAIDLTLESGWEVEQNPSRPEEAIFKGWIGTPDGPLLVRAILVRKAAGGDWYLREMSRGASLGLAVRAAEDEVRYHGRLPAIFRGKVNA